MPIYCDKCNYVFVKEVCNAPNCYIELKDGRRLTELFPSSKPLFYDEDTDKNYGFQELSELGAEIVYWGDRGTYICKKCSAISMLDSKKDTMKCCKCKNEDLVGPVEVSIGQDNCPRCSGGRIICRVDCLA